MIRYCPVPSRIIASTIAALAAVLVVLQATPARAQVGAGQLTGLVQDSAGAAVPGAIVTATDLGRETARRVISSAGGTYTIAGLTPGTYRLAVALDGFRPFAREPLTLSTCVTLRVDITLAPAGVQETVSVAAGETPLLREATASLGQVISNDRIVGLPLNGRSFISLAALAPAVALPPNSQLPRINGGRPRTNEYLFDGISVLQPEPGQVAFFPIVDAIQEFKVESNSPPAEFGRFNGGVVNLTTRAGTNAFHGTAFGFLRNCWRRVEARVPAPAVRRRARRSPSPRQHVLLRRLPGPAAGHRTHRDLHGADAAAA
jgi:Carboxypeptidase regulatory-like domain